MCLRVDLYLSATWSWAVRSYFGLDWRLDNECYYHFIFLWSYCHIVAQIVSRLMCELRRLVDEKLFLHHSIYCLNHLEIMTSIPVQAISPFQSIISASIVKQGLSWAYQLVTAHIGCRCLKILTLRKLYHVPFEHSWFSSSYFFRPYTWSTKLINYGVNCHHCQILNGKFILWLSFVLKESRNHLQNIGHDLAHLINSFITCFHFFVAWLPEIMFVGRTIPFVVLAPCPTIFYITFCRRRVMIISLIITNLFVQHPDHQYYSMMWHAALPVS